MVLLIHLSYVISSNYSELNYNHNHRYVTFVTTCTESSKQVLSTPQRRGPLLYGRLYRGWLVLAGLVASVLG